eukprot:3599776-Rhodomonas_salina.1
MHKLSRAHACAEFRSRSPDARLLGKMEGMIDHDEHCATKVARTRPWKMLLRPAMVGDCLECVVCAGMRLLLSHVPRPAAYFQVERS